VYENSHSELYLKYFIIMLSEILEGNRTVAVPVFTLLILIISAVGLIVFLVAAILYLIKKIRFLKKVRYGFGGKPLFSFIIVLGSIIFVPVLMYAVSRSFSIINLARADRDVIVEIHPEEEKDGFYNVSFMAIPRINNIVWFDKSYKITWYIEGEVSLEKVERDRTSENPSYFVTNLPRGRYDIKVQVESENFNLVELRELELE